MKENGFTLVELLAVIVVLALVSIIVIPIAFTVFDYVKGNTRTEIANRVLDSAKYFYTNSLMNSKIVYPAEGLEFICNKKVCKATIGNTQTKEGIAMLTEQELISYQLDFSGTIPSSGSIILYHDGSVVPKNLAIDSHLCVYDEEKKIFTTC